MFTKKMTSYNIYPPIPSAPEYPQVAYNLNVIQNKQQDLSKLEERYKKKYKKYTKILDRLTWLNACASGLSIASGISSVATLSTLIGLPVSISLGAISLAGASLSGVTTALTKKHQKKLSKVTKLTDIITSAIAIFEVSISKVLSSGKIDEEEFNMLKALYFKTLTELSNIDHKMGACRKQKPIRKSLLEKINDIKKTLGKKNS